jgi:oligogalacturonide lyase
MWREIPAGSEHSRRRFLAAAAGIPAALNAASGDGFEADRKRFSDPATEFEVVRLTDSSYTSFLPASFGRPLSKKGATLVYCCDRAGSMQAFRMEIKTGVSKELTNAAKIDPATVNILPDDRGICYFDGRTLFSLPFTNLKPRAIYTVPEGWEHIGGIAVAEDGLYAAVVEQRGARSRLRLVPMMKGEAATLVEVDGLIEGPQPRPKRASLIYRVNGELWLVHYDGQQNRKLKTADGVCGPAFWSPDGRGVLYLNFPHEKTKLNNLREIVADSGADSFIANTTQFVNFARNADASVFVGASGSKASPHVLLLLRVTHREFTLCEHRASEPKMVAPVFSPTSQRIYFESDKHGKPAIYTMAVDKLVEPTETG